MSGPVTMALGPFLFRAHGFGYTDVSRKLNTTWAEIETTGRMNALQWTGPRSEEITINGVLFPAEWGGESTLGGVRLAAKNGLPLMLANRSGQIFGMQAIQGVDDDKAFMNNLGQAGRISYSIKVRQIGSGFSLLSLLGII